MSAAEAFNGLPNPEDLGSSDLETLETVNVLEGLPLVYHMQVRRALRHLNGRAKLDEFEAGNDAEVRLELLNLLEGPDDYLVNLHNIAPNQIRIIQREDGWEIVETALLHDYPRSHRDRHLHLHVYSDGSVVRYTDDTTARGLKARSANFRVDPNSYTEVSCEVVADWCLEQIRRQQLDRGSDSDAIYNLSEDHCRFSIPTVRVPGRRHRTEHDSCSVYIEDGALNFETDYIGFGECYFDDQGLLQLNGFKPDLSFGSSSADNDHATIRILRHCNRFFRRNPEIVTMLKESLALARRAQIHEA